jgi:hypothetical protein
VLAPAARRVSLHRRRRLREDAARGHEQYLAAGCQPQPLPVANEQLHADAAFELGDRALSDCWVIKSRSAARVKRRSSATATK